METQPADFFDLHERKPRYGIKVKGPTGRFIPAGDDKGLFLFDTKEERDAKRKELSKMELPDPTDI